MPPKFHDAYGNTFHPETAWVLGSMLLPSFIVDRFSEAHHTYYQSSGKVSTCQARVLGVPLFICFHCYSHHYKVWCLKLSSNAENCAQASKIKSTGMGWSCLALGEAGEFNSTEFLFLLCHEADPEQPFCWSWWRYFLSIVWSAAFFSINGISINFCGGLEWLPNPGSFPFTSVGILVRGWVWCLKISWGRSKCIPLILPSSDECVSVFLYTVYPALDTFTQNWTCHRFLL